MTSMFSVSGLALLRFCRLPFQATMPSLREKMLVVGTGGATGSWKRRDSALTSRPLVSRNSRQALVVCGAPAKGVPSVMTQRTHCGCSLASSRA